MASSLSQLTGGGASAAPGGVGIGAVALDGAMGRIYSGEIGLILCGVAVVFCLCLATGARSAGTSAARPERPRAPAIGSNAARTDLTALRHARMASPDPEEDPYS